MGDPNQFSNEHGDVQTATLISEADALAITTAQNGGIETVDKRIGLYKQALQTIAHTISSLLGQSQVGDGLLAGLELKSDFCVFHIPAFDVSYKARPLLYQIGLHSSVLQDGIVLDIDTEPPVVADPLLLSCLLGLSDSHSDRQDFADHTEDVAYELAYATFCLALAGPGSMQQAEALLKIGRVLTNNMEQFRSTKQHLSVGHFITIFRRALETRTKYGGCTILYVCALSSTLIDSYYTAGTAANMEEAINLLRQSLAATSETHPRRYRLLRILAGALHNRFIGKGTRSDFQECVSLYEQGLQLCPVGHREHASSLANLGVVYLTECRLNPSKDASLEPLNLALKYLKAVYDQRPVPRRPKRHGVAVQICNALFMRFEHLGDVIDLQDCIDTARESLLSVPDSADLMNTLAGAFCTRFEALGEISDLEESIKYMRRVLDTWGEGHLQRPHALSNVGKLIMLRFQQTFHDEDLVEAIALLREALALSQPPNPFWAPILFNLSAVLKERYLHEQSLENLSEALDLHDLWLKHHTSFDVMAGEHAYLDMIAELLRLRFERFGDIADIHQALAIHEQAEQTRPVAHSTEHRSMSSLAQTIFLRGEFTHSIDDVHHALALQSKAAQAIQLGHVDKSIMLFGLARFYLAKTLPQQDIIKALDCYNQAINDGHCPASTRLAEGLRVLDALEDNLRRESWTEKTKLSLLDNYRATVRLLPQVAIFGLDVRTRLRLLSRAPNLAVDAAIHATRLRNGAIAIEVLEEAKAVFWTQYLRLRSSFDELPPALREQLEHTSRKLQASTIHADDPPTKTVYEDQQTERRQLSEHFDYLVLQARRLPGFDQFLLSDRFEALSTAAQRSPVLILLANSTFCGALLIRRASSNVEQLTLNLKPDSLVHANDMIRGAARSTRALVIKRKPRLSSHASQNGEDALSLLWHEVMQKVVNAMGWKKQSGHERPRLVICATGAFSDIPVHAAGVTTENCTDYFVPSYTPTLGALIAAHRSFKPVRCRDAKVLLAIAPRPFKWSPLPGAVAEAAVVKRVLSTVQVASVPQLIGTEGALGTSATCNDVLQRIPHANIFHLACHGHTNPTSVLESGFILADRMLMLTELMELNLPNAFFAFLSACESAKNSKEQGDQAVHLAAAMMFAGFKSVIGTMWSMNDIDGPSVAQKVYEELFSQESEYLSPDSIPYALDSAVRELRDKGLHPSRWAPYVHYGI